MMAIHKSIPNSRLPTPVELLNCASKIPLSFAWFTTLLIQTHHISKNFYYICQIYHTVRVTFSY